MRGGLRLEVEDSKVLLLPGMRQGWISYIEARTLDPNDPFKVLVNRGDLESSWKRKVYYYSGPEMVKYKCKRMIAIIIFRVLLYL